MSLLDLSTLYDEIVGKADLYTFSEKTGEPLLDDYFAAGLPAKIEKDYYEMIDSSQQAAAIAAASAERQSRIYITCAAMGQALQPTGRYSDAPERQITLYRQSNMMALMIERTQAVSQSSVTAAKVIGSIGGVTSLDYRLFDIIKMVSRAGEKRLNFDYRKHLEAYLSKLELGEDQKKRRQLIGVGQVKNIQQLSKVLGCEARYTDLISQTASVVAEAKGLVETYSENCSSISARFIRARVFDARHALSKERLAEAEGLLEALRAGTPRERATFFYEVIKFQQHVLDNIDTTPYGQKHYAVRLQNLIGIGIMRGYDADFSEKHKYRKTNPLGDDFVKALCKLKMTFIPAEVIFLLGAYRGHADMRWPSPLVFTKNVVAVLSPDIEHADTALKLVEEIKVRNETHRDILKSALEAPAGDVVRDDYETRLATVEVEYKKLQDKNLSVWTHQNRVAESRDAKPTTVEKLVKTLGLRPLNKKKRLEQAFKELQESLSRVAPNYSAFQNREIEVDRENFLTKGFLIENNISLGHGNLKITVLDEYARACYALSRLGEIPEKYRLVFKKSYALAKDYADEKTAKLPSDRTEFRGEKAVKKFIADTEYTIAAFDWFYTLTPKEREIFLAAESFVKQAKDGAKPQKNWMKLAEDFSQTADGKAACRTICEYILQHDYVNSDYWNQGNVKLAFAEPLRGFVWLLSFYSGTQVAEALTETALNSYKSEPGKGMVAERIGNACIWSLSELSNGAGARGLLKISSRVTYPKVKGKVDAAMQKAARDANTDADSLEEKVVPTYGMAG